LEVNIISIAGKLTQSSEQQAKSVPMHGQNSLH